VSTGNDLVAAGSLAVDALVIDGRDGSVVGRLAKHPLAVLSLGWSPGGARLATGGQDGMVTVWDRSGRSVESVDLPGWVVGVAWSPDGRFVAAGGGREVAIIRAVGTVVSRHGGHPSTVTSVAWEPSGRRVAVACYGGIRWYDPGSPAAGVVAQYSWKGSILVVAVSPDGRWLASGNQDSTSKVWEIATGEDLEMTGYPAKVERLAWEHRGHQLAVASGPVAMVWRCSGGGPEGTRPAVLDAHADRITDLRYQRTGPLLVTVSRDGVAGVWNPSRRRRPLRALDLGEPLSRGGWIGLDAVVVGTAEGRVARVELTGRDGASGR
jgi:WD40 repeat protein